MREGKIEQVGTAEEIYKNPLTSYVAHFIGDANVLPTKKNGDGTVHALGYDFKVEEPEKDYHFILRPEHIELCFKPKEQVTDRYHAPVTVQAITYAGSKQIVQVTYQDQSLLVHCSPEQDLANVRQGQDAIILWKEEHQKILQ